MNVYTELDVDGYERVVRCDNSAVGFTAWIAVHNTALGPALGGCRVWQYDSEEAALTDVLRLSKGMTYKNALAGLSLGGGKGVVNTDLSSVNRKTLFTEIGRFVEHLKGLYITAEDVNSTVEDMEIVKTQTEYVATVGASGNPSPFTALGVYNAILAAVKYKLGRDNLAGLTVAIQGVGETGGRLAERLYADGCNIVVADVNVRNIEVLRRKISFDLVSAEEIYDVECDIFAPCALGGILNSITIPRLKCSIIAGSANNQLHTEDDGYALRRRKILYVPDFAINAGGVINISCEIGQQYSSQKAREATANIGKTIKNIIELAEQQKLPTNIVANILAEEKFIKESLPKRKAV